MAHDGSNAARFALATLLLPAGCRQYFENRELETRAAKCGSEVSWSPDWATAARRATAEHKQILVTFQNYPGFEVGDLPSVGPFMDEEIIALTNAHFVPLRFRLGMEAPFVAPEIYGVGSSAFGVGLLVAAPDGRIVRETFSLDTAVVREFLIGSLDSDDRAELATEFVSDASPGEREALRLAIEGDLAAARDVLQPLAATTPRARFLAATLAFAAGEKTMAIELFRKLALEEPETRWSWHAAAFATSPLLSGVERLDLARPAPELLDEALPIDPEPLAIDDAPRALADAVEWLLDRQAQDGSWPEPSQLSASRDGPSELAIATAALGGLALLGEARAAALNGEAARASILRGGATRTLAFLSATVESVQRPVAFMDYSVWANPYALRFATECLEDAVGDPATARALADRALAGLVEKQKPSGGWSYYLAGSLDAAADPIDVSMSFTTACVLDALARARTFGSMIPDDVESRALDCLDGFRNDEGRFGYLVLGPLGLRNGGTPGDSAGRGPACIVPLLRAGRATEADLSLAVERFVDHLPALMNEQGKVLMHCGPEAEGSHYLLFDYLNAAVAWTSLGPADRLRLREPILAAILAAHNADRSFVDNPLIGRAAGTALAVLALRSLEVVPGTGLEPAPP